MRKSSLIAIIAVALAGALAAGCVAQSSPPPQEAMDAANATADVMFPALNSAEYVVFSQNFSDTMRAALNESGFNQMVGKIAGQYGRYESRAPAPSAAIVGDYAVFVYECQFEKSKLNLQITMNRTDPYRVEGFFYR